MADLGISSQNGRYLLHYTLSDIETREKMTAILAGGVDCSIIAQSTGLTIEEVEAL